jgi:hypothetical protein
MTIPEPTAATAAPVRTRIVLADVARQRRTATELAQQSSVGDALLRGLIRAQLAHALRFAAVVVVGLGGLPLLFALAPDVAQAHVLGANLPWLLLGIAAYPFLLGIGAMYVRLAERTEAEFTDLVERPDR